MSFYTGRYMRSHGANWNGFPLRVGEPTLGDHLAELGVRNVLVGKTHMAAEAKAWPARHRPDSSLGVQSRNAGSSRSSATTGCILPDPRRGRPMTTTCARRVSTARTRGRNGPIRPRTTAVRTAGCSPMATSRRACPRSIPRRPTRRGGRWRSSTRRRADGRNWCLHLSYIKPHWPYIAPSPYHDMYGRQDNVPPVRAAAERADPHPVYGALMALRVSRNFSRDEVRARVIPAYMGLIKQIDDQLGVLFRFSTSAASPGTRWSSSPATTATISATIGSAKRISSTTARSRCR